MKIEFKRAFTALLLSAATLCGCISAYAGGFDDTGDKYTREIDMVTGAKAITLLLRLTRRLPWGI